MQDREVIAQRFSAIFGFLGICLGAFGAHYLNPTLLKNETLDIWNTAVLYHLVHSVCALWASANYKIATWLWLSGIGIFSGSLYILALTKFTKLGMITPIGGLLFLAGWLLVAIKAKK